MYSQAEEYQYGWYQKDLKKEPVFADFKANGQYCKSGLAFKQTIKTNNNDVIGSECVQTKKVT
jgi:hypothetical protein